MERPLTFGGEADFDLEAGRHAVPAAHFALAGFYRVAHDGQTESHASQSPVARRFHAVEGLENAFDFRLRQTGAERPRLTRIADGITQQVGNELCEIALTALNQLQKNAAPHDSTGAGQRISQICINYLASLCVLRTTARKAALTG